MSVAVQHCIAVQVNDTSCTGSQPAMNHCFPIWYTSCSINNTHTDTHCSRCTLFTCLKHHARHFWCRYPTTVATLSRRARDRIETAFEQSVDEGRNSSLLGSRLHDFGFRGCTCVEQSVLGGVAHLLNFDGSDTLSAAYYAQVSDTPPAC